MSHAAPASDPSSCHERTGTHSGRFRAPALRAGLRSLHRTDVVRLIVAFAALVGTFTALGKALPKLDRLVESDERWSSQVARSRTPTLDRLSWWGSMAAESTTKVVVTAVIAVGAWKLWHRWRDIVMIVLPLALEASVFITVTSIVRRPRPDALPLDTSPVVSSFPSGHTAAAAAYASFAVVAFWHTSRRGVRSASVLGALAAPVVVGWARYYRGMHYVSDVTVGAILGHLSAAVVLWLIRAHDPGKLPLGALRSGGAAAAVGPERLRMDPAPAGEKD